MKKHISLIAITVLFVGFSGVCFAQDEQPQAQKISTPKWVSEKGYWVIEGNVHSPKSNTVYFYTLNNELVYTEKVEGTKIKLNKKKVCMKLKAALEQAVTVWEATHIAKENDTIVTVALKN